MIVDGFECLLVNFDSIAFAEFCHELVLFESLIVADYLIAYVCPFCRTLLEYLTEDANMGIAFDGFEFGTLYF